MVCDKVRIRFKKSGALRLISHHDLMRCFERMLRRAELPFHSTAGFNPKPRLVFALSLGLGIVGHQEIVELELDAEVDANEIHSRLARHAPDGLEFLSVQRIGPKAGAQVRRVTYRLPVTAERRVRTAQRIAEIMSAAECLVQRTKPEPRTIDVRPYLFQLQVKEDALEMRFEVTPNGTARPDEVVRLLELGDCLDAGAVLERTEIELVDETPGLLKEPLEASAFDSTLASPCILPDAASRRPQESAAAVSAWPNQLEGDS